MRNIVQINLTTHTKTQGKTKKTWKNIGSKQKYKLKIKVINL